VQLGRALPATLASAMWVGSALLIEKLSMMGAGFLGSVGFVVVDDNAIR